MPEQNLNPDALEAAKNAFDHAMGLDTDDYFQPWEEEAPSKYRDIGVEPAVSAYLTALPAPPDTVNSVAGVYDIGSPEPEDIDQVVECDELGHPYVREWDDDADYTWSKTTDGTRWKGYKNGKEYLEWPELVRRYGPVKPVEG